MNQTEAQLNLSHKPKWGIRNKNVTNQIIHEKQKGSNTNWTRHNKWERLGIIMNGNKAKETKFIKKD